MKRIIFIVCLLVPLASFSMEGDQTKRKKRDWYQQFDQRLSQLETNIAVDIQEINQKQDRLNKEMIRMNEKLESRFDKYFLWGYGTLLVIISTILNVMFNRRQSEKTLPEEELAGPSC